MEIRRLVAVIDTTLRFGDIRLPFVSYVLHVVEAGGWLSETRPKSRAFVRIYPAISQALPRSCGLSPASRATGDAGGRWRITSSPNTS